ARMNPILPRQTRCCPEQGTPHPRIGIHHVLRLRIPYHPVMTFLQPRHCLHHRMSRHFQQIHHHSRFHRRDMCRKVLMPHSLPFPHRLFQLLLHHYENLLPLPLKCIPLHTQSRNNFRFHLNEQVLHLHLPQEG